MYTLILITHIVVCVLLILIVLLQASKGAGLSGLFGGGGGGETIFGGTSGNTFLRKVTTVLAIAFMCTSLFLTFISLRQPIRTVTEKIIPSAGTPALPPGHPQTSPAVPPQAPPAETQPTPELPPQTDSGQRTQTPAPETK